MRRAFIFFERYVEWIDYGIFLATMSRRTHLPFTEILDFETAYQNALAEINPILADSAKESAEWNNLLKQATAHVGKGDFDVNIRAAPSFVFAKVINPKDYPKAA